MRCNTLKSIYKSIIEALLAKKEDSDKKGFLKAITRLYMILKFPNFSQR